MGTLARLRRAVQTANPVVRPLERERLVGEAALHHGNRLDEAVDADSGAVERQTRHLVLGREPTRADSPVDAPVRQHVQASRAPSRASRDGGNRCMRRARRCAARLSRQLRPRAGINASWSPSDPIRAGSNNRALEPLTEGAPLVSIGNELAGHTESEWALAKHAARYRRRGRNYRLADMSTAGMHRTPCASATSRCSNARLTHTLYWPLDIDWNNDHKKEQCHRELARAAKPDFDWAQVRAEGKDWPKFAQTMVGLKRLDNVQHLRRAHRRRRRARRPDRDRRLARRRRRSSCARCSTPTATTTARSTSPTRSRACRRPTTAYPADADEQLHTTELRSRSRATRSRRTSSATACSTTGCTSSRAGSRTRCPTVRDRTVVASCGSTATCTSRRWTGSTNLYPKLSLGGFLIVDDYGYEPCRQAVADYREANGIDEPIEADRLARRVLAPRAVNRHRARLGSSSFT